MACNLIYEKRKSSHVRATFGEFFSVLFGKVIAVYGDNNKMEYIMVHRFLSAKCGFF